MGGAIWRGPVLILIWAISGFASGQQPQQLRDRDPDLAAARQLAADLQRANFRFGPFYLLSRLRIADAGYSETAFLPTADNTRSFSLAIQAPQQLYFVPHKKTVFSAQFVPGYNFFADDDDGKRIDYLLRGDMHLLLNHLYLDVYTLRADQLRAHVADVNQLARTEEEETGVAGEFKYSSRTSALFSARYRTSVYPDDRFGEDDVPLALLDRDERNARVSVLHKTLPRTSFFVAGEGSNYGFRNASYKDSARRWFGGGAIWNTGRSEVRLEAGPGRLDFDDPQQRDFSGILGSVRGVHSDGRVRYHASVARDVGFAIFAQNNYYVADLGNAGVDYEATRRLTLRANTAWERDRFEIPVQGNLRRDTTSFHSVGFQYALRKLRTGLDVGWYERDTTYGGDEESGIRYVLHLSFTP